MATAPTPPFSGAPPNPVSASMQPPTITIGEVEFDLTSTPTPVSTGYSKLQRDALKDDMLIKVRNLAVKSNLPAKLTKGLQVTTYDPSDMQNKNNFFNFVSSWEGNVLSIETHLSTFYLASAFTLYRKVETSPSESELEFYQSELMDFLSASKLNNGSSTSYTDSSNVVHNRPPKPVGTLNIVDGGNIIREWHTMKLEDIEESVRLQLSFVADTVFRQNLVWTFDYFLSCLDADFKSYVLSKISAMTPEVGRTGPIVYYLVAKRLLYTSENLAQKVINGFISLRLTHFDGENVSEAIFTIRNVLKFLRFKEANSFAPPTTITIIYDVFRGTTVGAFRNHVQQAQDIILKGTQDPEVIFDHLQIKYEELLLADRWVSMKKKASAFVMGDPQSKSYVDTDKSKSGNGNSQKTQNPKDSGNTKPGSPPKVKDSNGKERYVYDRAGNKIDYTPPKKGESHERKNGERTEHWCPKCARWGGHAADKHEEFYENLKNKKASNNGSSNSNSSSKVRGNVSFAQATTGGILRLKADPELTDGIDL